MPRESLRSLRQLERGRDTYGGDSARTKLALLRALAKGRLAGASEVFRLHEALCFLRAYPDNAAVAAQVERTLAAFARRSDLRRHRAVLASLGVAGTDINFCFFASTAAWLTRCWPDRLRIDWESFAGKERLDPLFEYLVLFGETPGLDEWDLGVKAWLRRLKGPKETDAAFLIRRFSSLAVAPVLREKLYDDLEIPLVLSPGPDTPSRTRACFPRSPVVFVREGISRRRPTLPEDALRSPRAVRAVSPREAETLIDLARAAMVTRQRDLDVFSNASPADVRLVDWEDGIQFACIGVLPDRRLLLESAYGYLTLKNGVPVGYVLTSALFGSSEIAYNVFDTFRGGEAARIYGLVLATTRHLFGSDAFTIYPYQLGHGNEEAIRSGAWWFYQKIGFLPRKRATLAIMRRELARMRVDPGHRSDPATLRSLASTNLYYFLGKPRWDVLGTDFLANVGLRITDHVAARFGSDREEATRACSREAAALLGLRSLRGFSAGERLAWERWAPLVRILPGVARWSGADRQALADVVRAKGGRRESEFVTRFNRHANLRRAILRLGGWKPPRASDY